MQLNLKFEIEVLCKNLALDINELKPGSLLKDKDRLKNLDEQLSAPKKDVKQPEELPPITTTSKYIQNPELLHRSSNKIGYTTAKKNMKLRTLLSHC